MNTVRKIIQIDEELCNGCGECIIGCPEGAIQLVDGKARLSKDNYCDGLGACVGECPLGAITVIEREAEPYNERLVMTNIFKQGPNAVRHHLEHLKEHGEEILLAEALEVLEELENNDNKIMEDHPMECGCPGSAARSFKPAEDIESGDTSPQKSALSQWPVQMHLISPMAPHFQKSDFLLSADCCAYALGNFHGQYLRGKTLGIACPKLDDGQEIYGQKIRALIDEAKINTLTVMIMQVPCCQGLLKTAVEAVKSCARKIPVKAIVIGVEGEVLSEEWV